jgi:hypothetical protein
MDTDDGWRKIWAKLSDGELRDRLQYIVFLSLNSGPLGPQRYSKVLHQLEDEADRRGKREMVYEAMPWVMNYEARTASRHEGFWRSSLHADENLPWPQPDAKWPRRAAFLEMLDRAEAEAQRGYSRGWSCCRICRCRNGTMTFRLDVWEWPEGFRHYVAEHEVRPSPEFELFVREWAHSVKDAPAYSPKAWRRS